jgi:hypothetical protein
MEISPGARPPPGPSGEGENGLPPTPSHRGGEKVLFVIAGRISLIHHSSFMTHHSSFIIHHSSLIIHRSSLIIHHSSFITDHLSPSLMTRD